MQETQHTQQTTIRTA